MGGFEVGLVMSLGVFLNKRRAYMYFKGLLQTYLLRKKINIYKDFFKFLVVMDLGNISFKTNNLETFPLCSLFYSTLLCFCISLIAEVLFSQLLSSLAVQET